jgi:hypothetical protein
MAAEHVIAGICGFTIAIGLATYACRQIIQEHLDQRERERRREYWKRHQLELEAQWRRTDAVYAAQRHTQPTITLPPEVRVNATTITGPIQPAIPVGALTLAVPANYYQGLSQSRDQQSAAPPVAPIAPPIPPPHNPGRRRILPLNEPEP